MSARSLESSWEKIHFFCKIVWLIWQYILYPRISCQWYCTYSFISYFMGEKVSYFAFLLLASYLLLLYEWIEKIKTTHNIFLKPKTLAQTFTLISWKSRLGLKYISFLEIVLVQIQKLNLTNKKKSEIQKLHLKFKIPLKQNSKFEVYFLFFKKFKIDEKIRFLKGNLGDLNDQTSTRAKKKSQSVVRKNPCTESIIRFLI